MPYLTGKGISGLYFIHLAYIYKHDIETHALLSWVLKETRVSGK